MSTRGDHSDEMPAPAPLDDTAVEAFLSGRLISAGEPGLLAAFAEDVRMAVDRPAPSPTADLARVLTDGIPTPTGVAWAPAQGAAARDANVSKRRKPVLLSELLAGLVAKLAGLGMAAKAGLGMAVAAASVTGAGAANVLPDPAQHAVATAVSAATPFELPDPGDAVTDAKVGGTDQTDGADADGAGKPADNHGACVSEIARNAPRGPGGDHGEAVSTAARSDCGKSSTTTSSSSTTSTSTPSTTTTTIDGDGEGIAANRGPGGRGQGNGNAGPGNSGPGNSGNGNSGPGNSGNGNSGPGNSGNGGGSGRSGR